MKTLSLILLCLFAYYIAGLITLFIRSLVEDIDSIAEAEIEKRITVIFWPIAAIFGLGLFTFSFMPKYITNLSNRFKNKIYFYKQNKKEKESSQIYR